MTIRITDAPILSARPGATYWAQYLLFGPMVGVMFGAISTTVFRVYFRDWSPRALLAVVICFGMVGCTAVITFGVARDRKKLRCDLFPDRLVIGAGAGRQDVVFEQIESIVVGLPPSVSWIAKVGALHPAGAAVNQLRANSLVVRMRSRRAIALHLGLMRAKNGPFLLQKFVELNAGKFRQVAEYTDEERKAFSLIALNRIIGY